MNIKLHKEKITQMKKIKRVRTGIKMLLMKMKEKKQKKKN